MSNTPSTEPERELTPEEQRQAVVVSEATKNMNEARLMRLNAKVNAYMSVVGRLGARGARRKTGITQQDILLWNFIQAQHRAMNAAKAAVLGKKEEAKV